MQRNKRFLWLMASALALADAVVWLTLAQAMIYQIPRSAPPHHRTSITYEGRTITYKDQSELNAMVVLLLEIRSRPGVEI